MTEIRPDALELPPTQPLVIVWDTTVAQPRHP
jgi:hypothetical protein